MSLQRNSALSMRTICFSKPVSELVLQTGLTRPRSWTEEVSVSRQRSLLLRFPAQIETSASSRESKKRKLDKMVSVETVDGGKLKEAATKKADESILIQIGIESEIP
jgi:hypothetical protein